MAIETASIKLIILEKGNLSMIAIPKKELMINKMFCVSKWLANFNIKADIKIKINLSDQFTYKLEKINNRIKTKFGFTPYIKA